MIKTISIEQLIAGMHVHDLHFGWADHPLAQGDFLIADDRTLHQIRQLGIRELTIDTDKGLDVIELPSAPERDPDQTLKTVIESSAAASLSPDKAVTLAQELPQARRLQRDALLFLRSSMNQCRQGQRLDLAEARALVARLAASMLRCQDALLSLTRIRRLGSYTIDHSFNVAIYIMALGVALGLEPEVIEEIGLGALLHDIGKALIPERIINKPSALTDQEFATIKTHVAHGRELLKALTAMPPVALAVVSDHHERMNGSGYPSGKAGADISQAGRMAGIVDVYDAMSADRVYQLGIEPRMVLKRLVESTQEFDTDLVRQFIRCIGIYPVGTLVRLSNGPIGVVMTPGRANLLEPVVRLLFDGSRQPLMSPRDVDLAQLGGETRIAGVESVAHLRIRPEVLLQQMSR